MYIACIFVVLFASGVLHFYTAFYVCVISNKDGGLLFFLRDVTSLILFLTKKICHVFPQLLRFTFQICIHSRTHTCTFSPSRITFTYIRCIDDFFPTIKLSFDAKIGKNSFLQLMLDFSHFTSFILFVIFTNYVNILILL